MPTLVRCSFSGIPAPAPAPAPGGRYEIVLKLEVADVRTVAAGELGSEAAAAARAGRGLLGVAGGDGSMQAAASVLAGGGTVLAPLPTGTLNHFARRLGTPDLATAATAIAAGATRTSRPSCRG